MAGKRKASEAFEFDDAPGSSWPPPPWRADGDHDEESLSDSSEGEDSRSDSTYQSENDHAGGEYSSEESQIAGILAFLKLGPSIHIPEAEVQPPPPSDQPAAAAPAPEVVMPEESQIADILAFLKLGPCRYIADEAEVQPPPPSDQPAAAEVADQSVAAAATAPEVVMPAAESAPCLGCGREPALVRLVPVKHACLCLPCHTSPFGWPGCEFCDGPRH